MRTMVREWQDVDAAQIARARVVTAGENPVPGTVRCVVDDDVIDCEVLDSAGSRLIELVAGDSVLIWRPRRQGELPVVLGRIGPQAAPASEAPDELVLESKRGLTLKCGEGSITIRADGKILIKGKDLVSHATRLNRIRGGAVQIN